MQSTSLGPLEGDGEEFFLDILFHRMSAIRICRQPSNGVQPKSRWDKMRNGLKLFRRGVDRAPSISNLSGPHRCPEHGLPD
jgi:hypothetical protein